jgi:D-cysteine desulfhydrase family pyridoxal phosphate-dependent enzyme
MHIFRQTSSRSELGCFPTPLHILRNLGSDLGIDLWIKRDDLSGLGAGGNKVRKLEFLLAEAAARHATVLVTAGYPQSNHVLQTAAAGRRLKMRTIAVLRGEKPRRLTGNLLFDDLLACELEFLDCENFAEAINEHMEQRCLTLASAGDTPYLIPVGGSNPHGSLGYVECARELSLQYAAFDDVPPDYVVVPVGSSGTYAGLVVGCSMLWPNTKVLGIVVSDNYFAQREHVAKLVNETAAIGGIERRWSSSELLLDYDYIGEGYAKSTLASEAAIRMMAQSEGLFLDPTYTGKTAAGLIGNVHNGNIPRASKAIFIHTGGATALLA